MVKIFEVTDGEKTVTVKVVEIEGKEFYTIEAAYYENEMAAEIEGYYWNDAIDKWTKEILDDTTTIF